MDERRKKAHAKTPRRKGSERRRRQGTLANLRQESRSNRSTENLGTSTDPIWLKFFCHRTKIETHPEPTQNNAPWCAMASSNEVSILKKKQDSGEDKPATSPKSALQHRTV